MLGVGAVNRDALAIPTGADIFHGRAGTLNLALPNGSLAAEQIAPA